LKLGKFGSVTIAVVCALYLVQNVPAIVVEPFQTAVSQLRWNTYSKDLAEQTAIQGSETTLGETVTSAKKGK